MRERRPIVIGVSCFAVLVAMLTITLWRPVPATSSLFDRRLNGMWLGNSWLSGYDRALRNPITVYRRDSLIETLSTHGITDLFVNSGSIDSSGIHLSVPGTFFADLLRLTPHIRYFAWISGHADNVPMEDTAWQTCVASQAGQLTKWGFDGIHLDIEPIPNGFGPYVELLGSIRDLTDDSLVLSHATRRAAPFGHAFGPLGSFCWSKAFYQQTMGVTDQTVLMGYDSRLPTQGLYARFMAHQTRLLVQWASNTADHSVLIGVPTYQDSFEKGDRVENLRNGLIGTKIGLENVCGDAIRRFQGVALFAEYSTSEEEWRQLEEFWR